MCMKETPILVCLVFFRVRVIGDGFVVCGLWVWIWYSGPFVLPIRLVVLGSENVNLLVIILGLEWINGIVASYILRNYFYRFF